MTLLADIKQALRVSTDKMDAEVQMNIDAALYDMERVGVNPALLVVDPDDGLENAFVKQAVACYCKAQFGYDVAEAERFDSAYRRIVCDLMNSSENIAAMEREPEEEEANAFYGLTAAEVWASLSYRPTKREYQQACEWLQVEYPDDATNAQLRALLAEACGVEEGQ